MLRSLVRFQLAPLNTPFRRPQAGATHGTVLIPGCSPCVDTGQLPVPTGGRQRRPGRALVPDRDHPSRACRARGATRA